MFATRDEMLTSFLVGVKHFLKDFLKRFLTDFRYRICTKRRRRDLNPRAAINDLLPFQGSPFGQLGDFSMQIPTKVSSLFNYSNPFSEVTV